MPVWLAIAWRFLRPLLPYIAVALAVLAIVSAYGHREYQRGFHKRDGEVAAITRDRDTHASNERILQGALDRQNAAVSALKADGDKRTSDGKTALAAVVRANLTLKQQSDALRKSGSTPRPKDWPCVPSETLVSLGKL